MALKLEVGGLAARCAVAVAAFLAVPPSPVSAQPQAVEGEQLVRGLGCAGCHLGLPPSETPSLGPALGPDAVHPGADFVFVFLADPGRMRTVPRMPDFRLSERERLALALFLGVDSTATGSPLAQARERWPEVDGDEGETLFRAFNCAACHAHAGMPAAERGTVAPDLSAEAERVRPEWLHAYLSQPRTIRPMGYPAGSGSRMPDFRLSGAEAEALVAYLEGMASSGAGDPSAVTSAAEPLYPSQRKATLRLVRDRLSCLGCHQLGDAGGRIGPSLNGVGSRLPRDELRAAILTPGETALHTLMPTPLYDTGALDRVVSFFAEADEGWTSVESVSPIDLQGAAASPVVPGREPQTERGAALFNRYCVHCHGSGGGGDGWNAANLPTQPAVLSDPALMGAWPDDTIYDGIAAGAWVLDRSNRMPAFGGTLAPEEIRSLVAYIRQLCDCVAPGWSRDDGLSR